MRHILAILMLLASVTAAPAQDRTLLYLSAERSGYSTYGGIGLMGAIRGLDASGPVATVEAGRPDLDGKRLGIAGGWRFVGYRTYATALAGLEMGEETRPAGSLDLWWDAGRAMATARGQWMQGDDHNLRASVGLRIGDTGPWIGPEISDTWQGRRYGLHATAIRLPAAIEARASAGRMDEGNYFELSLWRRF